MWRKSWELTYEVLKISYSNLQPGIFIVKPTIPTNKTQQMNPTNQIPMLWAMEYPEQKIIHEMSCKMQNASLLCFVQSDSGETSPPTWMHGWTDSKASKTNHLYYQFRRRHATIIFEDREHALKNASICLRNMLVSRCVTTYVVFHGGFLGQALPVP